MHVINYDFYHNIVRFLIFFSSQKYTGLFMYKSWNMLAANFMVLNYTIANAYFCCLKLHEPSSIYSESEFTISKTLGKAVYLRSRVSILTSYPINTT